MRIILLLWAVPLGLFWGWYALSVNDISFGTVFLSRELHDLVFNVYGHTLGVPAEEIPAMIAWACSVDTAVIGAIAAWRWRAGWYPQLRVRLGELFAGTAPLTADGPSLDMSRSGSGDAARRAGGFSGNRVPVAPTALPDGPAHPAE